MSSVLNVYSNTHTYLFNITNYSRKTVIIKNDENIYFVYLYNKYIEIKY